MRSTSQLKHIFRRFLGAPAFTAITLLTIAVGIGATSAIFSVVNAVLLKPLPYPNSDRLVGVWETAPGLNIKDLNASPSTYFTFREENRSFEDIGNWRRDTATITGLGEPEQVDALEVTDGTFPVLGVQPALGRSFSKQDDTPGGAKTVMLFYGYWQRRFGGDPSAVGRTLQVDSEARQIIGVLPQSYRFMNYQPALAVPLQYDRSKIFVGNFSYQSVARLRPGVTLAQANADVARMLPMLGQKFPPPPGMNLKMLEDVHIGPNLRPLKQDVIGNIGEVLWVLMGTVGIVLFIACANVANLLLVRAEGRQQELAIRAALGAGWPQIARELLLESATLGLLGGALGLVLADSAIAFLRHLAPANLPRLDEIVMDARVFVFTFATALLAGLLFGLVPVFKYAGTHLAAALRQGGRSISEGRERHRARSALVVVQVALALILLISSGLMIRTFQAQRRVQPGFTSPHQVLTLRVSIPEAQVRKPEQVLQVHRDILRKIADIPGVTSAALANSVTMDFNHNNDTIFAEDRPGSETQLPPIRRFKFISPGLLKTLGNPIVAGRDFNWTDTVQQRSVVLISENFAREYWGSPAAAIGKRIREQPKAPWREIIGVAGNERDDGVDQKAPTIVYWPIAIKDYWITPLLVQRDVAFVIRSPRTGTASLLKDVQQAVWSVNANLPIANVQTLEEIFEKSMARTSFTLVMLALSGGMALLLGLVGIYGVISYSVSQRTREIGIRMALGAPQREVRHMFVRHGLVLTAIGVAFGLAAAIALTRLMSSLLFEVSPLDPITYAAVPVVLIAAALLASYLPARRATAIDPVDALRAE
jgi:putative ABC transport system permease protein